MWVEGEKALQKKKKNGRKKEKKKTCKMHVPLVHTHLYKKRQAGKMNPSLSLLSQKDTKRSQKKGDNFYCALYTQI